MPALDLPIKTSSILLKLSILLCLISAMLIMNLSLALGIKLLIMLPLFVYAYHLQAVIRLKKKTSITHIRYHEGHWMIQVKEEWIPVSLAPQSYISRVFMVLHFTPHRALGTIRANKWTTILFPDSLSYDNYLNLQRLLRLPERQLNFS